MSSDEPPHPDAGGQDGDSVEQPQIVVDDPEDFAKTRQLRAIFDARDDYIEARREANRLNEEGDLTFSERNRRIFRHLQDLVMTIEPLLKSYESGREIWEENSYSAADHLVGAKDLASFDEAFAKIKKEANYPDEANTPVTRAGELIQEYQKELNDSSFARDKTGKIKAKMRAYATSWGWEVEGLGELIKQTPKLKYATKSNGNDFGSTPPPQDVSDAAFRDVQDFIREIGLGVQFDTTQQTKIDDDLLEEVDAWRQTNVN